MIVIVASSFLAGASLIGILASYRLELIAPAQCPICKRVHENACPILWGE
jgi:hypothetical protein